MGHLEDGTRVYFGGVREPYGTMAERAVVARKMCVPLPPNLDDITAAAIFNPGISSWLSLAWGAQVSKGETVLVLVATGATGKMAVQLAKHFGAGKVIALGRNMQVLNQLSTLGADVTISLNQSDEELVKAISEAAGDAGIHVILDYLWGHPTEVVISAITRKGLMHTALRVRLIEIGQMAGSTITLPASVLRSSGLEILGSGAGSIPVERITEAFPQFLALATSGKLNLEAEPIPLADVEVAWRCQASDNQRLVLVL